MVVKHRTRQLNRSGGIYGGRVLSVNQNTSGGIYGGRVLSVNQNTSGGIYGGRVLSVNQNTSGSIQGGIHIQLYSIIGGRENILFVKGSM